MWNLNILKKCNQLSLQKLLGYLLSQGKTTELKIRLYWFLGILYLRRKGKSSGVTNFRGRLVIEQKLHVCEWPGYISIYSNIFLLSCSKNHLWMQYLYPKAKSFADGLPEKSKGGITWKWASKSLEAFFFSHQNVIY